MANGNKRTIVLVDDHVIIRNGLKELIEKLGNYTVSAQFDSGPAFLSSLQAGLYPDLLVLDISMPGMNGDAVLEAMGQAQVNIPSLVLTLDDNDSTVIRMFRLGARGYLRKNCSATELRDAIQSIFSHGYYHNEFLAYSLRTNSAPVKKTERELILEQLTPREKEFLKLVCHEQEFTYKQIADKMHVEPRTVDGYRENIFEKFGIKSKTGLVLFVLKHQLSDAL